MERQSDERERYLTTYFENLPVPDLSQLSWGAVAELLEHPTIVLLLGLLKGERNGLLLSLAHLPLDDQGAVARAAVTQGRVQGIDSLHRTLIELARQPNKEGTSS